MSKVTDIHEFASRWLEKYSDPDISEQEVEENFAEECFAIGFVMDCRTGLAQAFPDMDILQNEEILAAHISHIQDVRLLGSAIFSKWRYVTHWSESNLLAPGNRRWFILALAQLMRLTVDSVAAPARVVRISILYENMKKVVIDEETAEDSSPVTLKYNEQIVIDRVKETLEIRQQLGSGCSIRTEYCDEEGVAALLDDLDGDHLFMQVKGSDSDVIVDPNDTKIYEITVDFAKRPSIVLRGTFDRNNLPEDYPEAAAKILDFVVRYASIESLSPYLYMKRQRTAGDHIYCSVEFEEDGKSYYYTTDDDTLAVGDYVVVPVGRENRSAVVRIVAIDYFAEEEAPFPFDKVKKVTKRHIKEGDTDMHKQNAQLLAAMLHYDRGDAMRIQHLVKVHGFAAAIGRLEDLDEETQFILEAAAILHDVGIHVSLEKYGSSAGKYQELEGPAEAEMLMRQVGGYTEAQIERVKYLVGHHHTYSDIDGQDYQILVEADFLVNLDENASECEAARSVCDKIFKTETGKRMLTDIFLSEQ